MFNKIRLWMLEQQVKAIVASDPREKESEMATAKKTAPKKTAPKKTTKKK